MAAPAREDYSATPLPRKLGVREGSRIVVVGPPDGFTLGPLPPGAEVLPRAQNGIDVAVLFATRWTGLNDRFARLARALDPAGRLWVAWPKKAAKVDTDLNFDVVQGIGLAAGLIDNKSASIDQVFQGLQFVYRLKDRPAR